MEEGEVPVLGVVEVGEPAVEERADEVEGHGGVLVPLDHEVGVGRAVLGCEGGAVDEVPEVAGEGECLAVVVGGLGGGGAWFGVLPCEASDARDGGAEEIVVLHCTAAYPAPPEEANLATIAEIVDVSEDTSILTTALKNSFDHIGIRHLEIIFVII